jgi:hypothetical protein
VTGESRAFGHIDRADDLDDLWGCAASD